MYIRKSSSTRNGKVYHIAQIVEGYHTEDGKTRQHILFNLGSIDKLLNKYVTSQTKYGWLQESGVDFILGESKRIRQDVSDGIVAAEAARLSRPEDAQDTSFTFETLGEVKASVEDSEKK